MKNKNSQGLFKNTGNRLGRKVYISPKNSDLELLGYGRVVLNGKTKPVVVKTGGNEFGWICYRGTAVIKVDGQEYKLNRYDILYVPRDCRVELGTSSSVDLIECSAPADLKTAVTVVRFAEIKAGTKYHSIAGQPPCQREIFKLIDDNVPARRLLAGVTFSQPGSLTSWPPHEHTKTKEEIYLYIDMPAPAFGIQMVYENNKTPEFVGVVRENDAVVVPRGYHPNVACPGYTIGFCWLMAAKNPLTDRSWTNVNVQPEFNPAK